MFIAILMSTSCNKRLKHAIAIARDNSSELKVVLKHFESDPNPLKYKAGKFSYISKFHILISYKLTIYIVMCFYQGTN